MDYEDTTDEDNDIAATEAKILTVQDPENTGKLLKESLERELKLLKRHKFLNGCKRSFNDNKLDVNAIVEQVAKKFKSSNEATLKQIEDKDSNNKKEWKRTGCQQQYEHATKVRNVLQETDDYIEHSEEPEIATVQEKIKEGMSLLDERIKFILIAEEKGWDTVECYKQKDYADDEDDQKKIDKAEKKAIAERGVTRGASPYKGGKGGKGGHPYHKKGGFSGNCNNCGKYGHKGHECRSSGKGSHFQSYHQPMHHPYPPHPGFPPMHPGGKGGHHP